MSALRDMIADVGEAMVQVCAAARRDATSNERLAPATLFLPPPMSQPS